MARTKQPKLAKLIDNKALDDNAVIQIGEHTLSLGELRQMDAETDGGSTAELEQRQQQLETQANELALAQNNTITLLNEVAEQIGVPLDDLIGGKWKGKVKKPTTTVTPADDPELEGLDDTTKAIVLNVRKAMGSQITNLQKELADTKKALGIGISVSLDQYYDDMWEKLEGRVPKGADGKPLVKLDQKSVLKYATDNKLLDGRGRYDMKKAFNDLTSEARTQQMILEAEERGRKKERETLAAAAIQKPGASRPVHLTAPPTVKVGNHERTKTLDEVLNDARADEDIWKQSLSGGFGSA